jgi:hypothetical protein
MRSNQLLPFRRFQKEWALDDASPLIVSSVVQPVVNLEPLNWLTKIKETTIDVYNGGVASQFVGILYADNGRLIRLKAIYRGTSTGTFSLVLRQEKDLAIGRISTSSSSAVMVEGRDIVMDEMALGAWSNGNASDTAITIMVIYEEAET